MEIDWSKAPDWANELAINPYDERAWLGDDGYKYLIGNGRVVLWSFENAYGRSDFTVYQARPRQPVWTGEGHPPVGTELEVKTVGDLWVKAILAYRGRYSWVFNCSESDWVTSAEQARFRPIQTPEQIAADERDAAIKKMVSACACPGSAIAFEVCAALYDAGYRKIEIIEEKP